MGITCLSCVQQVQLRVFSLPIYNYIVHNLWVKANKKIFRANERVNGGTVPLFTPVFCRKDWYMQEQTKTALSIDIALHMMDNL